MFPDAERSGAFVAGVLFCAAADVLSPEGEENPPFVSLLLNALYASAGRPAAEARQAVFELRAHVPERL